MASQRLKAFVFLLSVAIAAPLHAATDATYEERMQAARHALQHHHGHTVVTMFNAERIEYQVANGEQSIGAELQGWVGGDLNRFWFKLDADYEREGKDIEEFELQALYSRAISAFWNLQIGLRHDFEPSPERTHLTLGVQGLAPYWLEIDSALFINHKGDVSLRLEGEYDWRLSQRWLLQPRIELNAAVSSDRDLDLGKGLRDSAIGLRLRYQVTPQFTPYFGIEQVRSHGATASRLRRDDQPYRATRLVAGLHFWL